MALTEDQKLRQLLGEDIPEGGVADDTLFSNAEIVDLIETNPNMDRAAYEGWRAKQARLASLVDTTEGNSQRKYSQLLTNAEKMVASYRRSSEGATEGRTRIGRIRRAGVEWP